MSLQVIAEQDFTATYGARVLSFTRDQIVEGEVARYLAEASGPVIPAPEFDHLAVELHNPVDQSVTGHQVHITTGGFRLVPIHLRYIWPSELDLMARLAGLDLVARYGDWDGEPFGVRSRRHISVCAKPSS